MKSFVKILLTLGLMQPVFASDCLTEMNNESLFQNKLSHSEINNHNLPQEIVDQILSHMGHKTTALNRALYERYKGYSASEILNPSRMDFSKYCFNVFACTKYIKTRSSLEFEKNTKIVANLPFLLWPTLKETRVEEIITENFNLTKSFGKPHSQLDLLAINHIPQNLPLKGTCVRTLNFKGMIINEDVVTKLGNILKGSPVRNVVFEQSFIMPKASNNFWSMIFESLVEDLKISHSRMNDSNFISMFKLPKNSALTSLDLSNNNIGSHGALALIEFFKEKPMRYLNLENNKVTNEISSEFHYILRQNSFKELNLRGNKLTDLGVLNLVKELAAGTSMTRLDFKGNNILTSGVKELVQKLHTTSPSNLSSWEINQLLPEAELAEQTFLGFNYGRLLSVLNPVGEMLQMEYRGH